MSFETGMVSSEGIRAFANYIPEMFTNEDQSVIGLSLDGAACGALSGHFDGDDMFVIDSLFVDPTVRHRGGGSLLMDTLMEGLEEEENNVPVKISFLEADEEGEALMEFLLSRGYVPAPKDKSVYLIMEDEAARVLGEIKQDPSFIDARDITEKDLYSLFMKSDIDLSQKSDNTGLFDMELSTVLDRDKRIETAIAVLRENPRQYCLFGAVLPTGKEDAFEAALGTFWKKAASKINAGDEILITVWKSEEKAAIEKMFPENEDIFRSFLI